MVVVAPTANMPIMSNSPTKQTIPSLPPPHSTSILAPPSPNTHRALRRLRSAQTLGSKASAHSLFSQQVPQQQIQRPTPSTHREAGNVTTHQRIRSNSDAPTMSVANTRPASRRVAIGKKVLLSEIPSLDRLIRDGPGGGDLTEALVNMRLKILDQGIKSDSDGMVGEDH